jgi:hypothetical protein
MSHSVTVDIPRPVRLTRHQVAVRLLLLIAAGLAGITLSLGFAALYIALPGLAAAGIGERGGARWLAEDTPRITRLLTWVAAIFAYFGLASDVLPTRHPERIAIVSLRPDGTPTVRGALLRLVLGLPSAFVLALLSWVSALAALAGVVCALVDERPRPGLVDLQAAFVRWAVRLLAYQASLVEEYPPFTLASELPPPVVPQE